MNRVTRGGQRWGGGEIVPDYIFVYNKPESEFVTAQVECS